MSFSLRRIIAIVHARNLEFIRDRGTLGWNIAMPVLLVLGLGFVLSGDGRPLFTVGIIAPPTAIVVHPVAELRYTDLVNIASTTEALDKLRRHQLDGVADPARNVYWVNSNAPKGHLLGGLIDSMDPPLRRLQVSGRTTRYIDWLVPGILGMNMMFSCLFGVGYVIVRYRKSGYLKRLNATPTSALDFITAQVVSRMMLVMVVTVLVFIAAMLMLGFEVLGSYLLLLGITVLGTTSLVAMGLAVTARVTSEELANGLLNLVCWPMMIVSGVWFSIEASPELVKLLALCFPLTHLLDAARAVMLDGAGLADVMPALLTMAGMTVGFSVLGAATFRWRQG